MVMSFLVGSPCRIQPPNLIKNCSGKELFRRLLSAIPSELLLTADQSRTSVLHRIVLIVHQPHLPGTPSSRPRVAQSTAFLCGDSHEIGRQFEAHLPLLSGSQLVAGAFRCEESRRTGRSDLATDHGYITLSIVHVPRQPSPALSCRVQRLPR